MNDGMALPTDSCLPAGKLARGGAHGRRENERVNEAMAFPPDPCLPAGKRARGGADGKRNNGRVNDAWLCRPIQVCWQVNSLEGLQDGCGTMGV